MTNKFLLNLLGFNPDLTSRQSRVDSVSILSRQSDLLTHLGRIAAILLLVLTIRVGNAWADGTLTVDYDSFSSHGTSYTDKSWSATTSTSNSISGSAIVCFDDGENYVKIKNGHPAFRNTTALPGAIKSIYAIRQSDGSNRTLNIYAGTEALTNSNYTTKGTSIGTLTVNTSGATKAFSAAQISAGYKYFYIYGSSNVLYLDEIVITFESGYTITFKETGGSNNGSGSAAANATSMTIGTAPTPATGKMVDGYYAENTLTTRVANANGSWAADNITGWVTSGKYTKGAAANLYIKWTDLVTTVTLDKGTDGTTDGTATITYNATSFTSKTDATKTGYHLSGYYTTAGGGSKVINADGSLVSSLSGWTSSGKWIKNATEATLYAHWTIDDYTVSWSVNGESWTTGVSSSNNHANYKSKITSMPTDPTSSNCDNSKVFVGWTKSSSYSSATTPPSDLFTTVAGSPTITGNTTFYAVFATADANVTAKDTWKKISSTSQITDGMQVLLVNKNSTTYYAINSSAEATSITGVGSATFTTNNNALRFAVEKGVSNYKFKTLDGKYLSTSAQSNNTTLQLDKTYDTWTISSDAGSETGTFNLVNSIALQYYSSTLKLYGWSDGYKQYFRFVICIPAYTNYATSCCTKLGTINGSVSLTTDGCGAGELKATWKMLATTGIASQTLRVYDENLEEVTAKRITGITASTSNQTKTISGLNPCKEYYVTVENVSSGGEYCAPGDPWESDVVTTLGYTLSVTKSNCSITSGSEPARICSNVSVTYAASTGYALPTSITVTNAGAQNTGWTWNSGTGVLTINKANVTDNVTVTITPTCVSPVIGTDPADASYYVGDSPDALSVSATLASGTLTYLWKVSTNGGSTWSDAEGTNNTASYSGASLSASSAGTTKFKCIVGNSQGGCTVESGVATITVTAASYFVNGETVFIQADSKDYSAWKDDACVKAWFNASGAGGAAQTTYWLFDATDTDAGKKLFAAIVPSTGDLNQVTLQRFQSDCLAEHWYNNNGTLTKASSGGVNTFRSYGSADNNVAWNGSSTTLNLYGSQNSWASSLASFADQGNGVWTASFNNYAPDATSKDYKIKTSYNNGWIGNTGSNNNATLSGMIVGSTYNVTATLDIKDHSLEMSKTFVKGTVHFDLQGHGSAISDLTNVTAGSKISAPSPAPSATGYTFGGWFTDAECTDEWNFATDEVDETMTLYAKWTANVYTITKTFSNVANAGLPASFTYTGATTTALNSTFTVDATNFFLPSSIAVTMGGSPLTQGTHYTYNSSTGAFTFIAVITGNIVITATAVPKLKSIAITTQPTTRKYFAGESFSSTGAVVTATMGDGSTKAVTASTTWTPSGALGAGTGQTVTASYTENGINQTATTTTDVYSVTVNKKNEDGDAIDVGGVTATWTVGTKALAAGVGSTKYAFKEWQVTGATPASTTSASTTLSSPTANVVVNAVFYKPRVVKWSVNGNDSYATGGPTTEVAYNGTISTVPTAPADNTLSCTNKFMGWSTKNAGTTPKTTSYYDDLFTNASGYTTNITAATTTFYAVFAEASDEINWAMGMIDQLSSGSGYATYDGVHTVTGSNGNDYTYTSSNVMANSGNQFRGSSYCGRIYNTTSLGRITRIVLDYSAYAGQMKVYESDSEISSSGTTALTPTISDNRYTYECSGKGYFIVIQEGSNAAKANVTVYFGDAPSNYVTQCDANIVKVTYDANGGSKSCTNTTTDKTEDYTVCSTPPTRDYYTFAGWLCSADSKTYAASATIDDAVIDADFTLTAQWTPVTYTITYNYNGGSAQVDPAPATSYTVESSDITLQTPTKGHDRFDGWYENADLSTGGVKTTIAAGSHENKTYYAKWTARHEIIFDADGATTTIYRADDEDLSASVAGQGSVPSDPDAPTTCSSKVFMGWSESTIDDETDDAPADLMKPAAGTVTADKHYYAVWATRNSESGTHDLVEDAFNVTGTDAVTSRSGWTALSTVYGGSGSIRFSSGSYAGSMTLVKTGLNFGTLVTSATITFKIKKYGSDGSGVLNISSNFEDATTTFSKDGGETTSTTVSYSTTDGSNWTTCTCTVGSISASSDIILEGQANARVYVKDFKITYTGTMYTYSAYSTSCCDKAITIGTPTKTGSGSVTFAKGGNAVSVGGTAKTCAGATTITATITPTNGHQCTALTFSRADGEDIVINVNPATVIPFTAATDFELTFEENANTILNTTVTFVALQDHYIDNMHYNATQNKSGNYGTAPTLTDETKGEQCTGLHYKFVGWIPETDMNMTTGVPTTTANMVAGGATGKYATGTNYYAIWAEEE